MGTPIGSHKGMPPPSTRLIQKDDKDELFWGAYLPSSVLDVINERRAICILELEDVAGNLDQVRVKLALVPLCKDVAELVGRDSQGLLHDMVGLANHLHVTVFNSVVDHLDIVSRTSSTDPVAARFTVNLGSNGLEDGLEVGPTQIGFDK